MVRGFGGQIGRHAANKVLNGNKQTPDNGVKNYLSFWEGIKTMMWSVVMLLVAMIITMFITDMNSPNFFKIMFPIWALMTFCIGYDYYKNPKYK
jgi:Na+/H+ antiporter NhaC